MLYNDRKAAQVAAFFLLKTPKKRMSILKLIKLLYLAERESIKRYHTPLLWDNMVSMPHGPVLSQTLDYINGFMESSEDGWKEWISDRENHEVSLKKKVNVEELDELSPAEIRLLNEIWEKYGNMNPWELRDWTHKNCPEWKDPKGSAIPITYKDLLKAIKIDEKTSKAILQHIEDMHYIDEVFDSI